MTISKKVLGLALATFLAALPAAAQRDFSGVEIKTIPVAGNVTMLEGSGGNIGVSAGADGLLIIDDQFAPLADKIKAALAAISSGDLVFVLNTHFHGDHAGGNEVFGLEAIIVAHANVRERLASGQGVRGQSVPAAPAVALPVITFDEGMSIHFNGEHIELFYAPAGHTDTDSIIYFHGSNVVHMGDHFFAGRFPFIDIASGGSAKGYERNVGRALQEIPDDVKIIPGHGPLSEKKDLQLFHDMLVSSIETVQKGIDAGKSVDDIKATGLSSKWDGWGSGFINNDTWITTLFDSLSP